MKKHILPVVVVLWACLLIAAPLQAEETGEGAWPKEIVVPEGTVVVYQPQPEKLEGDILSARAAVAIELKDAKEPVFGVMWADSRLETDRSNRTATIVDVKVTGMRFPVEDKEKEAKLKALVEREAPKWDYVIDMDRLLTTLEFAEKRLKDSENINNKPPEILISNEPAVLVTIDGEPRLVQEKGTGLQRVINTPFTILFETSTKNWYLSAGGDDWYTAKDIDGVWTVAEKVPKEVAARAPEDDPDPEAEQPEGKENGETGPPPKIVISKEPAELVVIRGEPEYTPIPGTDLLYVGNTDSDLLMDIGSQDHFLLLSGRWYASRKLDGQWKFVPGEKLPETFAAIPEDSEMGTVLYAVPGTEVAREAVLDAQIPQTAAVERKKAALTVEYDGEPKFEKIKGTKMTYAVNTATPVIGLEKKYYACDQAVWFLSHDPKGPWQVATSVPDEIYTIPADSPIYNVTFVKVYKATDEVVHVGYTPGYTHTYVYHDTIVYGTGWWWPGWYGSWYYPRPSTWGYHARWNPWGGWGFGFSYSSGPFTFSLGYGGSWYRGGWWGPRHYYGYNRGYSHGYRRGSYAGYRAGYRTGRRNEAGNNLYATTRNQARTLSTEQRAEVRSRSGAAGAAALAAGGAAAIAVANSGSSSRDNNVFAGRNGEVYRKTDQGWQERTGNNWTDTGQRSLPAQDARTGQVTQAQRDQATQKFEQARQTPQGQRASGATSFSTADRASTMQQLDRSSQARQRGAQRSTSYSNARSSRPSGGGRRGGGGRRR